MSTIIWNSLKSWDGKVSDTEFNRLVDAMQSITLNPGLNYNINRSPAGTTLVTTGGSSAAPPCPFTVTVSVDSDDSDTLDVSITPGTVANYLPSNMFDDDFTIAVSDTGYVKATVTTDGQNVTAVELNVDSSAPDQQNATANSLPTSFDVVLAVIQDSKVYRTIGCGSVSLNGVQSFMTDKGSPADPGESTTIPYFVWQVGVA